MSWEVEHAYWHYWEPGKHCAVAPEERAAYERYTAKAGRRNSEHRLLLLALALDAYPIDHNTDCEVALCWPLVDDLAGRLRRSVRTVQRLLRELATWNELEITSCDGHCRTRTGRHFGTSHYYLPLPVGAQPWGRRTPRYELQKTARSTRQTRQGKGNNSQDAPRAGRNSVQTG